MIEKVIDRGGVLLSMLALIGCLLASSSLHSHEMGLYDIDHACISCDLESLHAHGALPAKAFHLPQLFVEDKPCSVHRSVNFCTNQLLSIRGPPYHT